MADMLRNMGMGGGGGGATATGTLDVGANTEAGVKSGSGVVAMGVRTAYGWGCDDAADRGSSVTELRADVDGPAPWFSSLAE